MLEWNTIRCELLCDFYLTLTALPLAIVTNPQRYPLDRKLVIPKIREEDLAEAARRS